MLVLLQHCFEVARTAFHSAPWWLQELLRSGIAAVDFFFVLSGFVLAYNYYTGGPIRNGTAAFWRSRVARIYPVYFAAIVIALPMFLYGLRTGVVTPRHAVISLLLVPLLVQAWVPSSYFFAINRQAWSLSIEAFFYAVFPALMRLAANRATAVVATASFGLTLLPMVSGRAQILVPLNHIGAFALGISAAIWFHRRTPGTALRIFSSPYAFWAPVAAVLTIFCLRWRLPIFTLSLPVLAPLFTLIVLSAACRGLNSRFLQSRLLVTLGDASYALYILHFPLWALYRDLLRRLGLNATGVPAVVAFIALMISVSVISYRWFEVPARRALLRFSSRHAAMKVSAGVGA